MDYYYYVNVHYIHVISRLFIIIWFEKASLHDEEEIIHLAKNRDFARLAKKLGIKVIHCSERDTQIANQPKEVNEFVGTWSIEGLREEGTAPAEIGWGTHEQKLPPLANIPPRGPKN